MTHPTIVALGDLSVGDVVHRPHHGTVETVTAVTRRRTRTYVTFASGEEWTHYHDYQITKD